LFNIYQVTGLPVVNARHSAQQILQENVSSDGFMKSKIAFPTNFSAVTLSIVDLYYESNFDRVD
jgi:hypothetical protein